MKACLLFIHLISSFLSDSTLFLRDIFLKYSFSCLFMGKSTWFTVQTSSDVQGLGMFLYCILTLRLLVYWESISRMTTMTTALITARPPTGFSWFIFFFPSFLTFLEWFYEHWSSWFVSWISWILHPLLGEDSKLCLVWRVEEKWENLFLCPLNSIAYQQLLYLSKSMHFYPQHAQVSGHALAFGSLCVHIPVQENNSASETGWAESVWTTRWLYRPSLNEGLMLWGCAEAVFPHARDPHARPSVQMRSNWHI